MLTSGVSDKDLSLVMHVPRPAAPLVTANALRAAETGVVAIVQHAGHFQEALQSALAGPEPLNVSDLLVGLQGEAPGTDAVRGLSC